MVHASTITGARSTGHPAAAEYAEIFARYILPFAGLDTVSLTSIQRTVARWESADSPTVPGERYQLLLGHVFARDADGTLVLGPGSEFDILLTGIATLAHRKIRR